MMQDNDSPRIVSALTIRGGSVLMIQRSTAEGALLWTFPSGHIRLREDDAQAACRETFEETGIVVAAFRPLGQRIHPDTGCLISYMQCRYEAGEPFVSPFEIGKITQACFVPIQDALQRISSNIYPPVRRALLAARTP